VQLLDEAKEENDPAEHERQVEAVEAPVDAEYVPALQSTQVVLLDATAAAEYFPLPHPTHVAADDCPD
jgi:hypothetical protein